MFIYGQSGDILKAAKEHTKQINDIQTSVDLTMFISASKDNSAKVRLSTLLALCHCHNLTICKYLGHQIATFVVLIIIIHGWVM